MRPDAKTEHFGLSPRRLGIRKIALAWKNAVVAGERALTMVVRHEDEGKESSL